MRLLFDATPAGLECDADDRTLVGMAMPYNVPGRTSAGRVTIPPGVVDVPDPIGRVKLTREHDRTRPVGVAVAGDDTPAGLVLSFRVGRGDDGDRTLIEAADGVRDGLSVELDDVELGPGGVLRAGRLVSVAHVAVPAFDTARLAAADAADPEGSTTMPETLTDAAPADVTAAAAPAPDPAPATVAAAVPTGLTAARTRPRGRDVVTSLDFARAVVDARLRGVNDPDVAAALADVTWTAHGDNTGAPQWLGKLWEGDPLPRPFIAALGGPKRLTGMKAVGWTWGTTRPEGGDYAGDKTAIPTNTPTTAPVEMDAMRWAGGHDIDRAYFDFDRADFLAAYSEAMVSDYRLWSEGKAGSAALLAATALTASSAAAGIIAGRFRVRSAGGRGSAVFLSENVVAAESEKPADTLPSALADEVSRRGWDDLIMPGMPDDTVLVFDPRAADWFELSDPPVRVDALALALGGVDRAFFGYGQLLVSNPGAIVAVDVSGA